MAAVDSSERYLNAPELCRNGPVPVSWAVPHGRSVSIYLIPQMTTTKAHELDPQQPPPGTIVVKGTGNRTVGEATPEVTPGEYAVLLVAELEGATEIRRAARLYCITRGAFVLTIGAAVSSASAILFTWLWFVVLPDQVEQTVFGNIVRAGSSLVGVLGAVAAVPVLSAVSGIAGRGMFGRKWVRGTLLAVAPILVLAAGLLFAISSTEVVSNETGEAVTITNDGRVVFSLKPGVSVLRPLLGTRDVFRDSPSDRVHFYPPMATLLRGREMVRHDPSPLAMGDRSATGHTEAAAAAAKLELSGSPALNEDRERTDPVWRIRCLSRITVEHPATGAITLQVGPLRPMPTSGGSVGADRVSTVLDTPMRDCFGSDAPRDAFLEYQGTGGGPPDLRISLTSRWLRANRSWAEARVLKITKETFVVPALAEGGALPPGVAPAHVRFRAVAGGVSSAAGGYSTESSSGTYPGASNFDQPHSGANTRVEDVVVGECINRECTVYVADTDRELPFQWQFEPEASASHRLTSSWSGQLTATVSAWKECGKARGSDTKCPLKLYPVTTPEPDGGKAEGAKALEQQQNCRLGFFRTAAEPSLGPVDHVLVSCTQPTAWLPEGLSEGQWALQITGLQGADRAVLQPQSVTYRVLTPRDADPYVEMRSFQKNMDDIYRSVATVKIEFPSHGQEILPSHREGALSKLIEVLKGYSRLVVEVRGAADDSEPLALSGMRAQAVIKYLQAAGIEPNRMILRDGTTTRHCHCVEIGPKSPTP